MCHFRLWRSTRIRTGELCLALRRAKAGQKEGPKAMGDRSLFFRSCAYGGCIAQQRRGLICHGMYFPDYSLHYLCNTID